MKITNLLGLVALIAFTASPINGKISRSEHNKLYKMITDNILKGRKLIIGATPTNAVQTLQQITTLKTQITNAIEKLQAGGWPTAVGALRKSLQDTLGAKQLTGLQSKIEQAKQEADAATVLAARQAQEAADDAEAAALRLFDQALQEEEARTVTRPSAPPLPSAPPALRLPPRADIPEEGLPEVQPIPGMNHRVAYDAALDEFREAQRFPLEDALKVTRYNISIDPQAEATNSAIINNLFQNLLLPYMIDNFEPTYPRGREGWAGATLDTLMRPLKWVTSDVLRTVMGTMPIPARGEFNLTALQAFQDWVTNLEKQIKNPEIARKIIQKATADTEKKISRFNVFSKKIPTEEQAARILLAARLLEAANKVFARPETEPRQRGQIGPQPSDDESRQSEIVQQPAADESQSSSPARIDSFSALELLGT